VKIIEPRTEEQFSNSISDMDDLFLIEPSETEVHTNVVSDIVGNDTFNLTIPNASPLQNSIVHNNRSCNILSPTNIEQDSFYL
jgi:hypothetical protein